MMKLIKKFFKKYDDMDAAIDYLTTYIKYHVLNTYKVNRYNDNLAILGKQQLHYLISNQVNLTNKQINKVIDMTIKNIIVQTKIHFIITDSTIYVGLSD